MNSKNIVLRPLSILLLLLILKIPLSYSQECPSVEQSQTEAITFSIAYNNYAIRVTPDYDNHLLVNGRHVSFVEPDAQHGYATEVVWDGNNYVQQIRMAFFVKKSDSRALFAMAEFAHPDTKKNYLMTITLDQQGGQKSGVAAITSIECRYSTTLSEFNSEFITPDVRSIYPISLPYDSESFPSLKSNNPIVSVESLPSFYLLSQNILPSSCWDLNEDGVCNLAEEDITNDNQCTVLDCRGPQGPRGLPGDKGDQGPVGPQGIQGERGQVGPIGPQGLRGEKGETGTAGPQGLQGERGAPGPVGPQGIQGEGGDTLESAGGTLLQSCRNMSVTAKRRSVTLGCFAGEQLISGGGSCKGRSSSIKTSQPNNTAWEVVCERGRASVSIVCCS